MHGGFELLAGNALSVAKVSLGWESYEQQLLWQIIRAEFTNQELATYASEILKIINPDRKYLSLCVYICVCVYIYIYLCLSSFDIYLYGH